MFQYTALRIYRYIRFIIQFTKFKKSSKNRTPLKWAERYPCLNDNTPFTGFDRHYIYHPAWAMRSLVKIQPELHIDISSTLTFCALASSIFKVKFYDFRPPKLVLDNLETGSQDLSRLTFTNNSIRSLSCMHVVEHLGLGRYGDKLDINGDLNAISELSRVLSVDGDLLFVVPVAYKARIQFNAHRVYEPSMIIKEFEKHRLYLKEFVLIAESDEEGLITNPTEELMKKQNYGCGCFWFTKKTNN